MALALSPPEWTVISCANCTKRIAVFSGRLSTNRLAAATQGFIFSPIEPEESSTNTTSLFAGSRSSLRTVASTPSSVTEISSFCSAILRSSGSLRTKESVASFSAVLPPVISIPPSLASKSPYRRDRAPAAAAASGGTVMVVISPALTGTSRRIFGASLTPEPINRL
ncbi:hypothetical protein SDC9_179136 [bioreactor metagenome]|uniref:Uncharacterized protein n=1 Tax=bioreactor metagenome TaxID=1076179 RepID=A0A645H037_9ZZZZ